MFHFGGKKDKDFGSVSDPAVRIRAPLIDKKVARRDEISLGSNPLGPIWFPFGFIKERRKFLHGKNQLEYAISKTCL